MSQLLLDFDEETELRIEAAARASGLTASRWVAQLVRQFVASEWPAAVRELAGAWRDLPSSEEIRATEGVDVRRDEL